VCQNPLNPFDYSFTFWDFGVIPGCQDWWDCIGNLPGHEADRVIETMLHIKAQKGNINLSTKKATTKFWL